MKHLALMAAAASIGMANKWGDDYQHDYHGIAQRKFTDEQKAKAEEKRLRKAAKRKATP